MFDPIKTLIPRRVKRFIRRKSKLSRKPVLHYLELHLTDHCNLNCKGCGHFCTLAPPTFADVNQHRKDMKRLSQLFRNIGQLRLMGGEPLLHPDPASFLRIACEFFPETDLRFVTNGLLLPTAPPEFWEACRETGAVVDVTVYPPVTDRAESFRAVCEQNGVSVELREMDTFWAHRDLSGSSDPKTAFEKCRQRYFCPFLENGRIYICAMTALIRYFNARFGYEVPQSEGIHIHSRFLSGQDIKNHLSAPVETCAWCAYELATFRWERGTQVPDEWFVEMKKEGV